MLKLSAKKLCEGERTAEVQVFQGDHYAGMLTVVHADELVALLNAATDLFHSCEFMWRQAIMEGKGGVDDPNAKEYDKAELAIAKAKGGAG